MSSNIRRSGATREEPLRIVTRALLNDAGARVGALHLYKPVLAGPDEWVCRFRIRFRDSRVLSGAGHGGDSLHALLQALEGARKVLDGITPSLRWVGGDPGAHGVPMLVPAAFGVEFERRLQRIVQAQVEQLARALEARHKNKRRRRPAADE